MLIALALAAAIQAEPAASCAKLEGLRGELLRWSIGDAADREDGVYLRQISELLSESPRTPLERATADALLQAAQRLDQVEVRRRARREQVRDVAIELMIVQMELCPTGQVSRP